MAAARTGPGRARSWGAATATAGRAAATAATGATGAATAAFVTVTLGSFCTTALNPLIGSAAYETIRREPSGSIRL